MPELLEVLTLVATLAVGLLIGAVGVVGMIAVTIHRAANVSAFIAPAGTRTSSSSSEPLFEASQAELDAQDAWRGFETLGRGPLEGRGGPAPRSTPAPRREPCAFCQRVRKAVFGRFAGSRRI